MSGAAVAIGAFDGVHLGHQAVLHRLGEVARAAGLEPVVVTFEPLPREFLNPAAAPPRIQSLRDRVTALRASGVARICRLRFDGGFAAVEAGDFVESWLKARLDARVIVVGEDFRFGRARAGDLDLLRAHGLEVMPARTVLLDGERVSSSRVRAALAEADLQSARSLLGHDWTVSGRVRRGEARGRTIGFPTANIVPGRPLPILEGVYAVRVDGKVGAAYWGRRAGLGGIEQRLEVHVLDFEGDLYGQRLTVSFQQFIRRDRDISDLGALKAQIESDIVAVRDTMTADG